MPTAEAVLARVRRLYTEHSTHVRRGFSIEDMGLPQVTNHLLEEAVELQAALLNEEGPDAILDEAADVLIVLMHLMIKSSTLSHEFFGRVCHRAHERIDLNWTNDPTQVTATKPGFSRRNRGDATANNDASTSADSST